MKKLSILYACLITLIFNQISSAQAPDWKWSRYGIGIGASSRSYAMDIVTDNVNNVYTVGYSVNQVTIGRDTLINSAVFTPYLLKHNTHGDLVWSRKATYNGNAQHNSVATDNSGNIYCAGEYFSPHIVFGSDTLWSDSSGYTAYIVKYDSLGNVLWARDAIGSSTCNSLSIDADGNIYIGGNFYNSTVKFNSVILANDSMSGIECMYLVKYNASWGVIWGRTHTHGSGIVDCINAKEYGSIYLTGIFSTPTISFDTTTLIYLHPHTSFGELCLLKYDSSGRLIFAKSISGNYSQYSGVVADGIGSIYLAGGFTSDTINFGTHYLLKDSVGSFSSNLFLAKYDSSGNNIWAKTTPAKHIIPNTHFDLDSLKRPCMSGRFNSRSITILGLDTFSNPGNFIAQFDTSGDIFWTKFIVGSNIQSSSLAIGRNGNYFLAGFFLDTINIGLDTLFNPSSTSGELFISKLAWPLPLIATPVPTLTLIKAYPIPTNGILNISLGEGNFTALNMYDAAGKKVYSKTLDAKAKTSEFQLNTASFADGVYIIHALRNDGVNYQKVVIRH